MAELNSQPLSKTLRKQMLLAITPFLVAVFVFAVLAFKTTNTLSALRAYVQGESLWSSAQKEAVALLEKYASNGDAATFAAYRREIAVTLGDRRARLELEKDRPDDAIVRAGFLDGRNHADDVPGLISLYKGFRSSAFLAQAIGIWQAADAQIDQIRAAAEQLQASFQSDANSTNQAAMRVAALARLRQADARVTPLEVAFSRTLGTASRKIRDQLQIGVVLLAALMIVVKLWFSWWLLHRHVEIEHQLRDSEERFDLAVRGSNDGIWNWVPEEDQVYLSPRAIELLGYPLDDFPRRPPDMLPLVHAGDRKAVEVAIAQMLTAKEALNVEFRALDWSGNYRWVHVRGRPVRVENGRICRVAGSITDIRERKHSESVIRQLALDEQHHVEQAQLAMLEGIQGRIGRELHDDLGQRLTGVAFLGKALEQRLRDSVPAESEQTAWIVKLINEAIDRVRFLSRQLSPIEIDEITLAKALERLAVDIRKIFGTRIHLHIENSEFAIARKDSNHLFRIAQESVSNALRHGNATQIYIRLDTTRRGIRLAIADNGHGFDVGSKGKLGLGLRNMEARARSLDGRLRIRSSPKGTLVIVRCRRTVRSVRLESTNWARRA